VRLGSSAATPRVKEKSALLEGVLSGELKLKLEPGDSARPVHLWGNQALGRPEPERVEPQRLAVRRTARRRRRLRCVRDGLRRAGGSAGVPMSKVIGGWRMARGRFCGFRRWIHYSRWETVVRRAVARLLRIRVASRGT
jgi:hypothetical protein